MKAKLSQRKRQILTAITHYWNLHGHAPSVRDLTELVNVRSPNGIRCHLVSLQAKGYVTWETGLARTLRCTEAACALVGDVQ